ncbi:MAG: glycosyltransferase [Candidatus Helarchaeota archaeon]
MSRSSNKIQNIKIKALYKKYLAYSKKKLENTKTILFFPSGFYQTLSSGRFRCYNIAKYLKNKGYITILVSPKFGKKYRKRLLKIFKPDWVWIQKAYHPLNRYKYFKDFKIVFDLDDSDFIHTFLRKPIHEFFKKSQIITCGSEFIKSYAEKFSNNAYKIWTSFPIKVDKDFRIRDKEKLIIGWVATSPKYCLECLKFIHKALINLRHKYNFIFRIHAKYDKRVQEMFANIDWFEYIPYLPYNLFIEKIKEIDIGIHPLIEPDVNASNNYGRVLTYINAGKSFGKVLNYINAGIPCVVSNIGENPLFFKDGINGFIAKTPEDWELKLEKLLKNPSLREKFANQAFKDMKKEMSLENITKKYLKLLFGNDSE